MKLIPPQPKDMVVELCLFINIYHSDILGESGSSEGSRLSVWSFRKSPGAGSGAD